MNSLKARRLADFAARAAYAPDSVYHHRESGCPYIPIHPFGDEDELLARLGMRPDDCFSADAWWSVNGDATLIESMTISFARRGPGLYARATENDLRRVSLWVVTDHAFITRSLFEYAMTRFVSLGFPDGTTFRLAPPELVRVGD